MEVEQEIKLKLSEKEAIAIKKFIGKTSHHDRLEKGLTQEEAEMLTDFYEELCKYTDASDDDD